MSNEQSFLEAIKQEPENSDHKLVYADWLYEQGDPRSELLQREVEIAKILGGWRWHIHGILSAERFYGKLPDDVVSQVARSLPPPHVLQKTLEQCKEDGEHLLVLYPGLDIPSIRSHADRVYAERTEAERKRGRLMRGLAQYDHTHQTFAGTSRYHLVPKEPLPLFDRPWNEQVEVDTNDRSILRPRGFPHSGILHSPERANILLLRENDTGERLDPRRWLRCLDQLADGDHIGVGYFERGFGRYSYWDENGGSCIGLASFREFTL